jgi:EpsI family protein
LNFLSNKYARVLSVLLVVQGVLLYGVALRPEKLPPISPLDLFPTQAPGWHMKQSSPIEDEVKDVLKADDLLSRWYMNDSETASAYFFIAFFKTQREGQAPHSPKNCLPASGYEALESFPIDIPVAGREQPIHINRYLTARGEEKSVTLYWYQSHNRIIADEFAARFYLVVDSIRYHRSDTALVKIVVPVRGGDADRATKTAVDFAQAMWPAIVRQLPL